MLWRQLVSALDAQSHQRRRQLRLVVKGLVRNGELFSDHTGHYRLATQELRTSVLGGQGNRLTFDGMPLAPSRDHRFRAGDRVEAEVRDGVAFVLQVLDYSATPVVGELVMSSRYPYVEAVGGDYKGRVSLTEPPAVGGPGDTVAVRIEGQDRRGLFGAVVDLVASGGGAAQAADTLLASYNVPIEWPVEVERAAAKLPKSVSAAARRDREDLRTLPLVTIDGATAKDFDDAVYAERAGKGWRLVVAIADVAHYVKAGGALDTNAWDRGNSVYLPDRVIPMLPESLSNGLCSLRPREDRLALVCDMRVSATGRVSRFDFYNATIHSHARLTYEAVWQFLGGDDAQGLGEDGDTPAVKKSLGHLLGVFGALRAQREERGALDFESREAVIELDNDQPVAVRPVKRNDAHKLIEEAMIAANVCAARFLEQAKLPGIYRIHEQPEAVKVEQLHQALAFCGVKLPKGELTPLALQTALTGLQDHPNRWLFEMLVLRSLSQAVYARVNKGHFGLALPRYMHFTSPIRRYADLVVHRAIKGVLAGDAEPVASGDWLDATGEHISSTERRADEVSWGVDGWLKAQYMGGFLGDEFDGLIVSVTEFGVFVELIGYFVQGLVHISELGEDYYHYQATTQSLVGERSGKSFALGDELRVQLVSVNPPRGRIDLVPAGKRDRKQDRKQTQTLFCRGQRQTAEQQQEAAALICGLCFRPPRGAGGAFE